MKKTKEIDWIGMWFTVAKERGVNDLFQFARYNTKNNEMTVESFPHSDYDGAGALTMMLRRDGYIIDKLPEQRPIEKLSWLARAQIILGCIKDHSDSKMKWKNCDINRKYSTPEEGTRFSWILFTKEETEKINAKAKGAGVSQNSFLLESVCGVVLPELLEDGASGDWLFPANMRGIVKKENILSNHTSGVTVTTNSKTTAQEIHSQIKNKLGHRRHIGNWWLLHIGKIIGIRGMKYLSENSNKNCFRLGTFSCLGNWPIGTPPANVDSNLVILPAAPGTPNHPLGVATMTWNGQLIITMKINPYISADRNMADNLVSILKTAILKRVLQG